MNYIFGKWIIFRICSMQSVIREFKYVSVDIHVGKISLDAYTLGGCSRKRLRILSPPLTD